MNTTCSEDREDALEKAQAAVGSLVGHTIWQPRLGFGTFMTLEFGPVEPASRRPGSSLTHGQWHLWVYSAAWRLESPVELVTGSYDSRDRMADGISGLGGARVEETDLSRELDLTIRTTGLTVRTFAVSTQTDPHWLLWTPEGHVIEAGPAQSIAITRREEFPPQLPTSRWVTCSACRGILCPGPQLDRRRCSARGPRCASNGCHDLPRPRPCRW